MQLEVPVIAINAAFRPTKVDVFRKYVPSFRARIISNSGHLVMWDSPEEFNRLLEEGIEELRIESEK